MDLFLKYNWPGNLRELKNIVKRAVLLTDGNEITSSNLPQEMILSVQPEPTHLHTDLKVLQETNEKELILKTLEEAKYNKSKAAKMLNIDRTTLYYKLAKYKIEQ